MGSGIFFQNMPSFNFCQHLFSMKEGDGIMPPGSLALMLCQWDLSVVNIMAQSSFVYIVSFGVFSREMIQCLNTSYFNTYVDLP